MTVTIESIRRFGTTWKVKLSCGHDRSVTLAQINGEQLYIGRRVACALCQEATR